MEMPEWFDDTTPGAYVVYLSAEAREHPSMPTGKQVWVSLSRVGDGGEVRFRVDSDEALLLARSIYDALEEPPK